MSTKLKVGDINEIIALIQNNIYVNATAPVKRRRQLTVRTSSTDLGYGGYYGKKTILNLN
jgi:hypothetical protein